MITCKSLLSVRSLIEKFSLDEPTTYAVTYLRSKGYGRVFIANYLDVPERLVRKILTLLSSRLDADSPMDVVKKLTVVRGDQLEGCTPLFYTGLSREFIEVIHERVVLFRDFIVISSKRPDKVEVIGVCTSGVLEFPGVPENIAGKYVDLYRDIAKGDGLAICWRDYKEAVDEGVLLSSLTRLCASTYTKRT